MKKIYTRVLITIILVFSFGERYLFSQQSDDALKAGTLVPEFSLYDQDGKTFDLKNILGKQNIVVYFYPKDETPGCITEACTFRDQYAVFQDMNAAIVGISAQSVDSHKAFADHYKLPFTLLSDPDNKVRKMFGVATGEGGSRPGRVTFVIDKTGRIVYVFNSNSQPAQHINEALNILKTMK